jgi:NAD(P)-dependent dehydrogenase (short-subunit alcohol dehydrogenase family)
VRLKNKVVLITGAGAGRGAAPPRHMAQEGASIALTGIPAAGVEQTAADLAKEGYNAIAIPTDVSDSTQVQAAVARTVEAFGRLDCAVASAGVQLHDRDHTLHELDEDAWDQTHDINYRGVMLTCKYALAQMVKQGEGGALVIISSVTAMSGKSDNVSYLTGKHGLIGLNRYIGRHYGPHGIRCNCLCPGALDKTPNHDIHPNPEGRAAALKSSIPLGRTATPEDMAPWISFLCSDEARYATGAHFLVDGGMSA